MCTEPEVHKTQQRCRMTCSDVQAAMSRSIKPDYTRRGNVYVQQSLSIVIYVFLVAFFGAPFVGRALTLSPISPANRLLRYR